MMIKRWVKRTLYGVFGLSILFGGFAAYSHGHRMSYANMTPEQMAQHRTKAVDRIAAKMELNADQKARLNVLADKLQAQYLALHGASNQNPRAQVAAMVAGPKFDRAAAQAMVTEKTAAVQGKSPEVVAALGDFYDSLNPTQQQKVRDFMARHHGRGMMKHGG